MRKILKVAEREFIETVKTKTFLITLFLMPILIVGGMFLSVRLTRKSVEGPRPTRTIAVTDLSGELYEELEDVFDKRNESNKKRQIVIKRYEADESDLEAQTEKRKDEVRNGDLGGFLLIAKEVIEGESKSYYYMKARNIADLEMVSTIRRLLNSAVSNKRLRLHDISPKLIAEIRRGVPLEQVNVTVKGGKKREEFSVVLLPFFFLMLMFVGVFATNQQMLTSVIEEKTARVMEVILSAITPFQLMVGKILGLAAAGFTLIFVWASAGLIAAANQGMTDVMNFEMAAYFVIYFILGFLLFSSMLAAIGSVCNTIKEAQNLMMPVSILFIMPMVLWFPISQHPNGALAIVFSFIPFTTPMIMILRLAASPEIPIIQVFLSIVLLGASVPVAMWASAKIFRTGILMYGKPPSLRELLRWVRYR